MMSERFQLRRLSVVLAGAALTFGACGGSDGDASATRTGPVSTSRDSVVRTVGGDWCGLAADTDVVDAMFNDLGDEPREIEANVAKVEDGIARLRTAAPDEISGAAGILADNLEQLTSALTAADFEPDRADLEFMENAGNAMALQGAAQQLDAYTQRECGVAFGNTTDLGTIDGSGSDGSNSGTGASDRGLGSDDADFDEMFRDEMMNQLESSGFTSDEAECLVDRLDILNSDVDTGVDDMLDAFKKCGVDPGRLADMGG